MTAPIAQLVVLLMSAGLSADVVGQAVDLAEQHRNSTGLSADFRGIPPDVRGIPPDTAAERRRAYDRERKRVHRNSTGIPPDMSADIRDSAEFTAETPRISEVNTSSLLTSFSESSSEVQEKKEVVVEGRARPARSARGTRLPEGWEPSVADWQMAIDLIGVARADAELPKFRDWWASQPGQSGVKLDWNATWRTWIRRASEQAARGPPVNGHQAAPRPGSREDTRERTVNALAKLKNYARSHADDARRGDGSDGPAAGLLPFGEPPRS